MAAKFYAVRKGRTTGIFTSWSQCQQQVTGYPGASFKSFPTRGEAQRFLETGFVGGQADVPQKAEANAEAVAYVDGSYHAGTGEFACGAVIFYQGEAFEISQKFNDPDLAAMRNVAGEIKGSEAAIAFCLEREIQSLEIHHDYEGIAKWCTGEWKANKEATKAYRQYYLASSQRLQITFVKVKGTFEDSSGTVVDTDWTYVVGSEGLAPGETKSYRLSVPKDYTIRSCTVSILDYD